MKEGNSGLLFCLPTRMGQYTWREDTVYVLAAVSVRGMHASRRTMWSDGRKVGYIMYDCSADNECSQSWAAAEGYLCSTSRWTAAMWTSQSKGRSGFARVCEGRQSQARNQPTVDCCRGLTKPAGEIYTKNGNLRFGRSHRRQNATAAL